ncbi:MAG: hypothetical protein ABF274_02345 [Nonlabens sp.]|uniref:hypothetical protein n=1 Tax=Nonlabens sp. TaxID=1888209 RepID=UPI00321AF8A9
MRIIFLLALCMISIVACDSVNSSDKNYYFYHWKTSYQPTKISKELISQGGASKEYVRFFDLVINQQADKVFPVATVQFDQNVVFTAQEIVPVIYIRNEVFLHKDGSEENLKKLAKNTADKIKRIQNKHLIGKAAVKQIQLDCDWTDSTRDRFFQFLEELKIQLPGYFLSSTLRLHQVKFKERTGVPPVDRVVLMAYNVGDLGNVKETNSIISNDLTSQYLKKLSDYPLPFDVALPLFEWGVLYRDGELKGILKDVTPDLLSSAFAKAEKENFYIATSDSYVNGVFVYSDDVLRLETITKSKLEELASMIKDASKSNLEYETIFYHINSPLTNQFSHEELSSFAK